MLRARLSARFKNTVNLLCEGRNQTRYCNDFGTPCLSAKISTDVEPLSVETADRKRKSLGFLIDDLIVEKVVQDPMPRVEAHSDRPSKAGSDAQIQGCPVFSRQTWEFDHDIIPRLRQRLPSPHRTMRVEGLPLCDRDAQRLAVNNSASRIC